MYQIIAFWYAGYIPRNLIHLSSPTPTSSQRSLVIRFARRILFSPATRLYCSQKILTRASVHHLNVLLTPQSLCQSFRFQAIR
jgi:hypothetical protein